MLFTSNYTRCLHRYLLFSSKFISRSTSSDDEIMYGAEDYYFNEVQSIVRVTNSSSEDEEHRDTWINISEVRSSDDEMLFNAEDIMMSKVTNGVTLKRKFESEQTESVR